MFAVINGDGILCCPHCGGENLHQGDVEVFNRRQEDAPSMAVLVPAGKGPIVGEPDNNPSSRRQGLTIGFWCEWCGLEDEPRYRMTLQIYQHKGNTFVAWGD